MVRLDKITKNFRALFLAYDQGMEHGPSDLDEDTVNPDYIFQLGIQGKFTAVITQRGIAEKYYADYKHRIPLILKLNGKTSLTKAEPFSPLSCTVEEAIHLGASAVGYTVYVGSPREDEMLSTFAHVVETAHRHHMPAIGWMYPRGEGIDPRDSHTIAYAARVGLEVGADIIKINYPGSVEALEWAIRCAGKTKVVVSGGSKASTEEVYDHAHAILKAGALGYAIGRNVWQQEDPIAVSEKLRKIIINRKIA